MPDRAPAPCPDCGVLVHGGGRCERHRKATRRESDARRGSAAERGYDARWRRYRVEYLRLHPLCAECERNGQITAASVVDHIKPHKGNVVSFWDPANHQPLCKPCHDHKTATDDGGFGRAPAAG